MRFTVVWVPSAEAQLANLWIRAADRCAISASVHCIDSELRNDPERKGVMFGPFRALFDDPMSVLFTADPGDCMARVIQVRRNQ
jgi:hypothetical protein